MTLSLADESVIRGLPMKEVGKFLGFLILLLGFITFFSGQVYAVGWVGIVGGNITLTVSETEMQGEDLNLKAAVDTSCRLSWRNTDARRKKITVSTNLASPKFTLKVLALNPVQGTSAGEITLSTTVRDFVTSIPRTNAGSCTLQYTTIATVAQGTGQDTHRIIYTILNV